MNVNFEYYRTFYYVARYSNFTKAAQVLGNSQPNITRAMNCLEQELSCTLFIRTNRGVRLTPEGERLYASVTAAMGELSAAENEIASGAGLTRGSISISASETALNIYLLAKLRAFHMEHPGIRLRISNHNTKDAIRAVRNGEADFAVVTSPTSAGTPLTEVKLAAFREILVGGKTFTALGSQELTLAELGAYSLICLGRETMTYQFYRKLYAEHGLELQPDTEASTADQILPLVRADLGLAFLPEPLAADAIKRREILQIPLKDPIPPRDICLVYDRKRPLGMAAQKLKTMILADRIP